MRHCARAVFLIVYSYMALLSEKIPHVIIHLECGIKTQREILQGILGYVQRNNPWTVTLITGQSQSEPKLTSALLKTADGYIGHTSNSRVKNLIENHQLAILYSTDIPPRPIRKCTASVIGSIGCDNNQVGTIAADYFLNKGFKSFAYIHSAIPMLWSKEREAAFSKRLKAAGFRCQIFSGLKAGETRREHQIRALRTWLEKLPMRTAVLVANDARGQQILNICTNAKISVPGHLSVLSCDDEEIICETSLPTLSSIQLNAEQIGFAAAQQMDRHFFENQRPIKPVRHLYGVIGIRERASTGTMLPSDDPLVERAKTQIQLNVCKHLLVHDLARSLSVSKRLLEMRFRRATGCSIHSEIVRIQAETARNLISHSKLPLEAVAEQCGYASASHLCTVFKRQFGKTPGSWRKSVRKETYTLGHQSLTGE